MITAEMIKELRSKTGAGVMACKKMLTQSNGDMKKALEILKEQEAVLAVKKSERVTSEGSIGLYISDDKRTGSLVEINCETDFVASNKEFFNLTGNIAQQITLAPDQDMESFLQQQYLGDSNLSVKDVITSLVAKFGENINFNRFTKLSTISGTLYSYIHNGNRIGVIVELVCDNMDSSIEQTAKEVAMQIAATNPLFLSRDSVKQNVVEQERESYKNQALSEGKPSPVIEKIVTGKLNKFFGKNCLLEQTWIKNEDMTIAEFLNESSENLASHVEIAGFARFELGEKSEHNTGK
jgi:elongation factor Ts